MANYPSSYDDCALVDTTVTPSGSLQKGTKFSHDGMLYITSAIEAIQTTLGINPQAGYATVDERIEAVNIATQGPSGQGFTWRSEWADDVEYLSYDVVSCSGASYVAVQTSTNKQPDVETDYWDVVAERGLQGVQGVAGERGPQGLVGETGLQGPAGIQGVSGTPGTNGTDGTNGVSFIWLGPYSESTDYVLNDVTSASGSSYICILDNGPSTAVYPPSNETYWQMMASVGNTGATGSAGPAGEQGLPGEDGVNGQAGNDGQGFNWAGTWDVLSGYVAYDTVEDSGDAWVCILANTGNQPALESQYWSLFAAGGPAGPSGNPGEQGVPGDPGEPGEPGAAGQGFRWMGSWNESTLYYSYDVVVYQNTIYVCILDETGGEGNEPDARPDAWDATVVGGVSRTGLATTNYLAKFNSGSTITQSSISDTGSLINLGSYCSLSISGDSIFNLGTSTVTGSPILNFKQTSTVKASITYLDSGDTLTQDAPQHVFTVGSALTNGSNSLVRLGYYEFQSLSIDNAILTHNLYYNGTAWKYRGAGYGTAFQMVNGETRIYYCQSGAAGADASPVVGFSVTNTGVTNCYNGLKTDHIGEYTSTHRIQLDNKMVSVDGLFITDDVTDAAYANSRIELRGDATADVTIYLNSDGVANPTIYFGYGSTYVASLFMDYSTGKTHICNALTSQYPFTADIVNVRVGVNNTSPAEVLDVGGTIKGTGYKSSDGTAGATGDIAVAKVGGGTRTLSFKNGLYTGYTDS